MTDAPVPKIPEEMVEMAAVAIREADACGEMRDGERVFCDGCCCQDFARIALTAAGVPALLARVEELEAALAPFGALASQYEDYEDDTPLQSAHAPSWRGEPAFADLTIGGLRKAAALAKKGEG